MILGLKSVDCCVNVTLKVLRIVSNVGGLLEIHIWNKGVVAGEIFTRKPQYPGTKGPATARGTNAKQFVLPFVANFRT